jgi:hypothetical protein
MYFRLFVGDVVETDGEIVKCELLQLWAWP